MERWSFLTNHARVLVCIAHDPGVRLRDIAAKVGITERRAYGVVTDLADSGYVVKEKDGRRVFVPTRTSSTSPIVRSWVMASRSGRWAWIVSFPSVS